MPLHRSASGVRRSKRIAKQFPIYKALFAVAIWTPALAYYVLAPTKYESSFTMILPGAGAQATISLADIGQANSQASTAFGGDGLSASVTYKNLLMSPMVQSKAAENLKLDPSKLDLPKISLTQETALIKVNVSGPSAEDAKARADAYLSGFQTSLNQLRADEAQKREASTAQTVTTYAQRVETVRQQISQMQKTSGLNSPESYQTLVQNLQESRVRLAQVQTEKQAKRGAVLSLAGNLGADAKLAALTLKLHTDPIFAAYATAAATASADYAQAASRFGSKHAALQTFAQKRMGAMAKLRARAKQVTGLRSDKILSQLDMSGTGEKAGLLSGLVTSQTELASLEAKEKTLAEQVMAQEKQVYDLIDVAAKLESLTRDYKVADAVFASALARINATKTDVFASYPMVQVTQLPEVPEKASTRMKMLVLAMAGLASLLLLAAQSKWLRNLPPRLYAGLREKVHAPLHAT